MANVPRVSDMTNSKSNADERFSREWDETRKIFKHNRSLFGKNKIGKEVWKETKKKTRTF